VQMVSRCIKTPPSPRCDAGQATDSRHLCRAIDKHAALWGQLRVGCTGDLASPGNSELTARAEMYTTSNSELPFRPKVPRIVNSELNGGPAGVGSGNSELAALPKMLKHSTRS